MNTLTALQKHAIHCIETTNSRKEAAAKFGCNDRTFRSHIAKIRSKGYDVPFGMSIQEIGLRNGYTLGKITTHVQHKDGTGVVKNEWLRQFPTEKNVEEFVSALEKRVSGKAKKISAPKYKDTDISIWLPIGDPHFGMYAWSKEAGEDYDIDIAISRHESAIRKLLDVRDRVDVIVIAPLGDFFHADNRSNRTEKSGHTLDSDSRYWRIMDMAAESMCRSIEYAATKAKKVIFTCPPGNHDWHSSGAMLRIVKAYYRKTKHIEVRTDEQHQIYLTYGNNLIGLCHGDTEKLKDLPSIMSHDKREDWGKTKYHYWFTGHIHTQKVFEHPSCIVESFNTLAANDAWTTEKGFRSRKQMTAIVLHKEHGEIERRVVRPEHFE